MRPVIRIEELSFSYRGQAVLAGLSLDVAEGGVTALLGPNGSGKTTLLKLILGLLKPAKGTLSFRGRDLQRIAPRELAREMAYVPQVHREAFGYRVEHIVLMGRMPHTSFFSGYGARDRLIATEAMERLGIAHLAHRPYTEVSGGERQLALIARALTQGAQVFIMDEPTNGLDYGHQVRLLGRMSSLAKEGLTFLFSTHHPDHALSVADRVVMMQSGAILHDSPVAGITSESLRALYGVDVRILPVHEGQRVCVPVLGPVADQLIGSHS
jgi:iron complex transport system ATP-binding protein